MVVVRAGDGREWRAHLVAQGGGRTQEPRCLLGPTLHARHPGQSPQAGRGLVCPADVAPHQLQALSVRASGPRIFARLALYAPEPGKRVDDRVDDWQPSLDGKPLLLLSQRSEALY